MAADGGVTAALASAKKTLNDVAHSNINTTGGHAWSYRAARAARASSPSAPSAPASGLKAEAESAGKGIKSRMETEDAARKSLESN